MAYVGQGIKNGTFSVLDTSGNTYSGSNTTFNLGTQVGSPAQLLVSHDGVIQKPVTDYTIATGGTQITFTTAPASGASIFITEISGAVGAPMNRDINGDELILDADADTSITADTDDQIDVRVGGSDIATLTSSALTLKNSATADNSTFTVNLQTAEADIAQDDVIAKINFQAPNEGTGTDANLIAASIQATSEGDFSSSSNATKLEFMTGASEAATTKMSISSGGIVGIGATLPGDLGVGLHIKVSDTGASVNSGSDALVLEDNGGDMGMTLLSSTSGQGRIFFGDSGGNDRGQLDYDHGTDSMRMYTAGSEHLRMESDGQLLCGFTSQTNNSLFQIDADHTGSGNGSIMSKCSGTGEVFHVHFQNGNGGVGGIKTDGSATAYATSSDYRLKENVSYSYDATTRLKQLKPARFNWIADDTNTLLDGFLAHEVSSIVPEAITGTKDQTKSEAKVVSDANGNVLAIGIEEADWTQGKTDGIYASNTTWNATKTIPVYQGIDQAKLVPLLVKTVQELEARVKTLEDA